MKPDFGMLWLGDVLPAIEHFKAKYYPTVDFVLASQKPDNCPEGLWQEDKTIQKGHVMIGAYNFKKG